MSDALGTLLIGLVYTAEPPSQQLSLADLQIVTSGTPVDETPPSLVEVAEAVGKLKDGKAPGIFLYHSRNTETWGKTVIHGLHMVPSAA